MLNRTNRTLSAKTNRLNLGTRSLVLVASGIDGKSTLRTRPAHGFAMRGRMFGSPDPSIQPSAIGNSSDPGSSPAHRDSDCVMGRPGGRIEFGLTGPPPPRTPWWHGDERRPSGSHTLKRPQDAR